MRFYRGVVIASWKLIPISRNDDVKYRRHLQFLETTTVVESQIKTVIFRTFSDVRMMLDCSLALRAFMSYSFHTYTFHTRLQHLYQPFLTPSKFLSPSHAPIMPEDWILLPIKNSKVRYSVECVTTLRNCSVNWGIKARSMMWGMANYFAVNASYSNRYAFHTLGSCKDLLKCSLGIATDIILCAPNEAP